MPYAPTHECVLTGLSYTTRPGAHAYRRILFIGTPIQESTNFVGAYGIRPLWMSVFTGIGCTTCACDTGNIGGNNYRFHYDAYVPLERDVWRFFL